MNVFPFIEAEKAEQDGNVAKACELLEVSRSAFYDWRQHRPSARHLADEALGERIQAIFDDSRRPGSHRVCHAGPRRARGVGDPAERQGRQAQSRHRSRLGSSPNFRDPDDLQLQLVTFTGM